MIAKQYLGFESIKITAQHTQSEIYLLMRTSFTTIRQSLLKKSQKEHRKILSFFYENALMLNADLSKEIIETLDNFFIKNTNANVNEITDQVLEDILNNILSQKYEQEFSISHFIVKEYSIKEIRTNDMKAKYPERLTSRHVLSIISILVQQSQYLPKYFAIYSDNQYFPQLSLTANMPVAIILLHNYHFLGLCRFALDNGNGLSIMFDSLFESDISKMKFEIKDGYTLKMIDWFPKNEIYHQISDKVQQNQNDDFSCGIHIAISIAGIVLLYQSLIDQKNDIINNNGQIVASRVKDFCTLVKKHKILQKTDNEVYCVYNREMNKDQFKATIYNLYEYFHFDNDAIRQQQTL